MPPPPPVQVALPIPFDLAEGPRWDPVGERLVWVDIPTGRVFVGRLDGDRIEVVDQFAVDETVGAAAVRADGGLLVAGQRRMWLVDPDGTRREGLPVVAPGAPRRLNDGACDPQGRFLVGTCALGDPASTVEQLVRVEDDGTLTVVDDDLTLSNGLGWSADGQRMFSVDSVRQVIYVRDYAADGIGPRSVFAEVAGGQPDGIAVDAEDHLWVAVWGAGAVRRHAPDGRVVGEVPVPAPHTSAVALAGPDLRTMVVTTAAQGLSPQQRMRHPSSGMLFATRVDVPGLPSTPWRLPCT